MKRLGIVGVLGLLAGIAGTRSAFAVTITPHQASECFQVDAAGTGGVIGDSTGLVYNPSSSTTSVLWCPLNYDVGNLPTAINISGVSGGCNGSSYGIAYNICAVHQGGGTPSCTSVNVPTAAGSPTCSAGTYQIGTSTLPSTIFSGDYLILNVILQPWSNVSVNGLYGYQVTH